MRTIPSHGETFQGCLTQASTLPRRLSFRPLELLCWLTAGSPPLLRRRLPGPLIQLATGRLLLDSPKAGRQMVQAGVLLGFASSPASTEKNNFSERGNPTRREEGVTVSLRPGLEPEFALFTALWAVVFPWVRRKEYPCCSSRSCHGACVLPMRVCPISEGLFQIKCVGAGGKQKSCFIERHFPLAECSAQSSLGCPISDFQSSPHSLQESA